MYYPIIYTIHIMQCIQYNLQHIQHMQQQRRARVDTVFDRASLFITINLLHCL